MWNSLRRSQQDFKPLWRFATGYAGFVRNPTTSPAALARIRKRLLHRNDSFLALVKRRIFDYPESPYLPLFRAAGCDFGDVASMVQAEGLAPTLSRLAAEGVRVSIDEFKARIPIQRSQLSLEVDERAFDNPYLAHHLEAQSGGTRSAGTRVLVDLDFIAALADDTAVTFDAHNLWRAKQALWLPVGGTALIASRR